MRTRHLYPLRAVFPLQPSLKDFRFNIYRTALKLPKIKSCEKYKQCAKLVRYFLQNNCSVFGMLCSMSYCMLYWHYTPPLHPSIVFRFFCSVKCRQIKFPLTDNKVKEDISIKGFTIIIVVCVENFKGNL